MNEYEMMTVFHPRLNADETSAAVTALEEQVATNGGEMLSTDNWGRRRLAYPIDGVVDGTYVLLTFKMPAGGTAPLERWIRLSENTIRHLLIRGIIPFEGDRHGRDDRDDRDSRDDRGERGGRDDRGERDGRGRSDEGSAAAPEQAEQPEQPRAEASPAAASTSAEAADSSADASSGAAESSGADEPSGEGAGEAAAAAEDTGTPETED